MPFTPEESKNLNVRPKDSGQRQQLFSMIVSPKREALLKKAVDMALEGNESMMKILLDRLLPSKPVDEPVNFDLPGDLNSRQTLFMLGESVIKSVAGGNLTPSEGKEITTILNNHCNTLQLKEIEDLWGVLKKQIEGAKHD